MTRVTVKYEIKDFADLPVGRRFVLAYEYSNTQDELPIGLDWQAIYTELSVRSYREMVKFRYLQDDGELREAGLSLDGWVTSAIDPHEKVITGPSLRDLDRYGPDLPDDSIELLLKTLTAGAFNVDSVKLPMPSSLPLALLDRPKTSAAFERGFATERAGLVSLTNLGILRALQELDKRENP